MTVACLGPFRPSPETITRLEELFSDNRHIRVATRLKEFYEGYDLSALNTLYSSLYFNIALLIHRNDVPYEFPFNFPENGLSLDDMFISINYYEIVINYVYFELFGVLPDCNIFGYRFDEAFLIYDNAKTVIKDSLRILSKRLSEYPCYSDARSQIHNWTPDWKPPFNYDDNFDDDTDDIEYDYQTILMRRDLPEEPNPLPRLFCFHCYTSHEYATCLDIHPKQTDIPCYHINIPGAILSQHYPELRKRPMRFKRWTS